MTVEVGLSSGDGLKDVKGLISGECSVLLSVLDTAPSIVTIATAEDGLGAAPVGGKGEVG